MENETSDPPYRGNARVLRSTRKIDKISCGLAIFAILFQGILITWIAGAIKADLAAASRPERILVRIPTPVPGPVRLVDRACPLLPMCPVMPRCVESVRSVSMDYSNPDLRCGIDGIMHTTIRDHFLIVECRCPTFLPPSALPPSRPAPSTLVN